MNKWVKEQEILTKLEEIEDLESSIVSKKAVIKRWFDETIKREVAEIYKGESSLIIKEGVIGYHSEVSWIESFSIFSISSDSRIEKELVVKVKGGVDKGFAPDWLKGPIDVDNITYFISYDER